MTLASQSIRTTMISIHGSLPGDGTRNGSVSLVKFPLDVEILDDLASFWAKGMSTCCTIGAQTCPDNICQPFSRRLLLSRGGTLLEMSLGRSISRRRH